MQHIIHRADTRGRAEYGWLHTRYSFSFADWYDPTRMGFGALRVLNDDIVDPGHGFDPHAHRNMEIITIVTRGAVSHRDSMGNEYTVPAGDVQVMSAGTGVTHAEYNYSPDTPLELFQVWIEPSTPNLPPRYAQQSYNLFTVHNTLTCIAAPHAAAVPDALTIGQDAYVFAGALDAGATLSYQLHQPGQGVYLFVVEGSLVVDGVPLATRDAIGVAQISELALTADTPTRVLLFEVPYTA